MSHNYITTYSSKEAQAFYQGLNYWDRQKMSKFLIRINLFVGYMRKCVKVTRSRCLLVGESFF
jgi:hypothetical protein